MTRKARGKLIAILLVSVGTLAGPLTTTHADELEYRLGQESLVNTGIDNGYTGTNAIDKNDVHWGWQLGQFYVSGFTRATEANDTTPVFLKNVGDTVTLWFALEQDINQLNSNDQLSIAEDKNGWNQQFGIAQQNFGHGALIVKHTDYTNESRTNIYTNFLVAHASPQAATQVEVFEEGDYEVALDYEVKHPRLNVFGWKPSYANDNYQVSFKFSVRNGNSMVFPFDVTTGSELTNNSITASGFRLDLAKSRYLNIDIRREVLNSGADGLVEDTRFNRPATDGDEYTDEGIYTIVVSNQYTGRETTKVIYVGDNVVLKAHAVTGLSIPTINEMVSEGAEITDIGTIVPTAGPPVESNDDSAENTADYGTGLATEAGPSAAPTGVTGSPDASEWVSDHAVQVGAGVGVACLGLAALWIALSRRRHQKRATAITSEGCDH